MSDPHPQQRLDELLEAVKTYAPDADVGLISSAYLFAARAHEKQTRKSGEAYLTHPLAVAFLTAELKLDVDAIATALLHDTMEDCLVTKQELDRAFNPVVAELVDGVTKIGKLHFRSKEEAAAENFRKMLIAMSRDVRVILVKLADRMHNMRTLGAMRRDKRARIAGETMEIFVPLANRLGIHWMRSELEDLCFENLHPEHYAELKAKVEASAPDREAYIERVVARLRQALDEAGVEGLVSGRAKHLWSIHRKMVTGHLEYEQVHDLIAFRVLVDDLADCYAVLGHMHGAFKPVAGRIKDYIAMPKPNGYQSLHTTVFGPEGQRIEVQIRTHEMHRIAEQGIAAHWRYKEGHLALKPEEVANMAKLRTVLETAQEVADPDEFMEAVKYDLSPEAVYVFTPAGDVREFPEGATVLDFAYAVHTQVGNRCTGAKVDGRMVPLRYELQSGDTLEVLTNPTQTPRRGWLELVKTGRALRAIRKHIRIQEQETGLRIGQEMLDAELKKWGSSMKLLKKEGRLKAWAKEHGHKDLDPLLLQVARGHLPPLKACKELLPDVDFEPQKKEADGPFQRIMRAFRKAGSSPIQVQDTEDVLVSFARCCNPLPREPIAGYITRGRGISVHRRSCPQLLALEPERRMSVEWAPEVQGQQHQGEIRVVCVDQPGLLATISQACSEQGINISRAEARGLGDAKAECSLQVGVRSLDELQGLIHRLEGIPGVISVDRAG